MALLMRFGSENHSSVARRALFKGRRAFFRLTGGYLFIEVNERRKLKFLNAHVKEESHKMNYIQRAHVRDFY